MHATDLSLQKMGITRIVQVCIAFAVLLTLERSQPARKQTQARLWVLSRTRAMPGFPQ